MTTKLLPAVIVQTLVLGLVPKVATASERLPDEYLRVGLGALVAYDTTLYKDAESEFFAFPLVELQYQSIEWNKKALLWNALETEWLELSPQFSLQLDGYEALDSTYLAGMADRESALHGGIQMEVEAGIMEIEIDAQHDVSSRNDGYVLEAELDFDVALSRRLELDLSLGVQWLSADYSNYYYGVRRDEARTDRPEHDVSSAINPFLATDVEYAITDTWRLGAYLTYTVYDAEITRSPIVEDRDSVELFLGFAYDFYL